MNPTRFRALLPLFFLFGSLYFVQGLIEPTACLPAQPLQSQLRSWNYSEGSIGRLIFVIGIAWSLKPLFGLVSDFLPLGGRRRRPYLILSTGAAGLAFLAIAAFWTAEPPAGASLFGWLVGATPGAPDTAMIGWLLLVAGFGIAMTDVVIDALAVETGQPLGITGQIQAVQWLALSVAGLVVGVGGGYVAEHGLARPMFAACGLLAVASLATVLLLAKEPRHAAMPREGLARWWAQLRSGRLLALGSAAAFLFLWGFNPFSSNVLQAYMTEELGLGEQFYGTVRSVQAAGTIAACLAYGWYCRRVPFGVLIHAAILCGVVSSLGYLLLAGRTSAVIASFWWGLAWQTGLLIQLDLSARVCPTEYAGTMFALLMAVSNSGESCAIFLGGDWYERLAAQLGGGRHAAFDALVLIAAAFTAGCWLIVPLLKRAGVAWK